MFLFQRPSTTNDTQKVVSINSKVRALAFLSDECVVSCEESSVQLRHLDSVMGEPIESSSGALTIAASRDGCKIVIGTTDGFEIWSRVQGSVALVARHAIGGVRTIDISSDSKWALTGSDARTADVWDISTGERRPDLGPLRHEYNVIAVKFCPCGERIATATLYGSVRIFATSSGRKLFTIPISVISTLAVPNVTFAWSAQPSQIFAVSQGQIKCLNSDDGSQIYHWAIRSGVAHPPSIALSPNCKLVAYSVNDTVILRNTATREQICALKHDGNVSCIAFSPRSDLLVTGADTKFTIWDLRKLFTDTSCFSDTIEALELCERHQEGPARKQPPSTYLLPLMSISNGAVKAWLHSYLEDAEKVLSKEIEDPKFVPNHDIYANRAIIRGRLEKGAMALEDAQESLCIRLSAIGVIAKVIALIQQKEYALAKEEIPKVLQTDYPDKHLSLLKVLQSILFSLSGEYEREVSHITKMVGDRKLLSLVEANMHLSKNHFENAMESFNRAHMPPIFPHDLSPDMWTISFIFGWKFSGLGIQIQQKKCEFLLEDGNPVSAHLFDQVRKTYQREIVMHVKLADWSSKFSSECLSKLKILGDQALDSENWTEAIKHYTAVELLMEDPASKHKLLLNRSRAYAKIPGKLEQASQDANEAIKLDPSSPWGYDRKHEVLYATHHYCEAAAALDKMIIELTHSGDEQSDSMRKQGVNPGETKKVVMEEVEAILGQRRPHILINTKSKCLCNKQKQIEAFGAHPHYKELVLAPTSRVTDSGDWKDIVRRYFRYSTLSHTWEDQGEPKFQSAENWTVDSLDSEKVTNLKLKTFCKTASEHGYWWAWSDTCCINKEDTEVLNMSLRSMYQWYSESSLTVVHLKGVHHPLMIGLETLSQNLEQDLDELLEEFVKCRWNGRAWTLQEYFASRVIHFYTEDWKPYLPIDTSSLDTNSTNHKQHRAIQRGMELVTRLSADRLDALRPGSHDIRQKLSLASQRKATEMEDIAYSLLGIFKVTIETIYGHDVAPRALGRLLEALLNQSADTSILAWTGNSSEYNTCFPAEISVYQESELCHIPGQIDRETFAAAIATMRSNMAPADLSSAIKLHDQLLDKVVPEVHQGRLKLWCIRFPVLSVHQDPISCSYTVNVEMLGSVEIRTKDDLRSARGMSLVHPWFGRSMSSTNSLSESARQESALELLAFLKQPFGALLFTYTSNIFHERIAADQLIKVQIREDASPQQLLEKLQKLNIR